MSNRGGASEWLTMGSIVLLGVIVRFLFMEFTVDDAYITLRYARNVFDGNGFVYNVGERVYGTTTPLFTLLLAGFYILTDNPLFLGKALNVLSDIVVAVLIFRLARGLSAPKWVGYFAALLYVVNPVSVKWSALGMETGLYTALVCLSLWQHGRQHYRSGYLFAAVAFLTRIDGILVFGILVLTDLVRRRRGTWVDIFWGATPVILWSLFAGSYFGSPIPHSAWAKKLTYGGIPPLDSIELVVGKFLLRSGVLTATASILALIGMVWGLICHRNGRPILAWWIFYWLFFIGAGSRLHGWYLAPPIWVYVLCIGLGIDKMAALAKARLPGLAVRRHVSALSVGVMIGGLCVVAVLLLRNRYLEVEATAGVVEKSMLGPAAMWLKSHSEPGDTVCLESIGTVGYISELYVLDAVGLVSPQVVPLNRQGGKGPNFGAIVQTFRPKYYVWWESWEQAWWRNRPDEMAWLEAMYEKKAVFNVPGKAGLAIWQRK